MAISVKIKSGKKSDKLSTGDKEFVKDLKKSMHDVRLHQSGKKKLKSAKQLLNEI